MPRVKISLTASTTKLIKFLLLYATYSMGIKNFYGGDKNRSQMMMRARVFAQGFTILAIVAGSVYGLKPSEGRPKTMEEKMEQINSTNK